MVFWVEHAIGFFLDPISKTVLDGLKRTLGIDEEKQARAANTHYIHQLQADLAAERHAREMTDQSFTEKERYWRGQFKNVAQHVKALDNRCDQMEVTVETSYEIVNGLRVSIDSRFSLVEHLINADSARIKEIEDSGALRIHLEPGERNKLKDKAAENGLTVVQYVRALLRDSGTI